MKIDHPDTRRFIKYCLVGVLNTLVTLSVIFITKSFLGWNPYLCNAIGYTAGVINSFLWNKNWVFRSNGAIRREALIFLGGFALCYTLQFAAVLTLTSTPFGAIEIHLPLITISGYGIATLLGNILYTIANFLYNKLLTFR